MIKPLSNPTFVTLSLSFISRTMDPKAQFETKAWLERVIVYGIKTEPKSIKLEFSKQSAMLEFSYDPHGMTLLIRKPKVNINVDFDLILQY